MSKVVLTPTGKQFAEDTTGTGPKYDVLYYLYELGVPVEVDEVIDHLNTDPVKAQAILRALINEELIREV